MKNKDKDMSEIINHLKTFGFVFQSSEIYGGLANTWDYGPLGILLINNIKKKWWKEFITLEENNVGFDSKILLNSKVWQASGHLSNFTDPLIENKINNKRYRADHIYEELTSQNSSLLTKEQLEKWIQENVKEYDGSKTNWTNIRQFNLMFQTAQGIVEDNKNIIYLRPETAQGIFINFNNVQRSMRLKLPFGIGQIGKSFRNEVTPGNFIFRTREFEQMELEYFTYPDQDEKSYKYYVEKSKNFILSLGIKKESIRLRIHEKEELAHYSKGTTDIEFEFPFGWGELMGIANRTDFDLKSHNKISNTELKYFDQEKNESIIPYVIEPSVGVDRLLLAIIVDSFIKEKLENNDERIVMRLNYEMCPYKACVLPLVKKQGEKAKSIFRNLIKKGLDVLYDETGSIGKRYRRQDAIGTYWCITYDYDSEKDDCVTIRHRDTMKQERIKINNIFDYIINKEEK
ncbi:glycine--tRNA ligase [Mesomycoplasma moatsii]|uniref:glycine--tRNA ligase n=1 Tax=Mesomycoplasma moatsii TaxID=171287 RepID=UPI0003B7A242